MIETALFPLTMALRTGQLSLELYLEQLEAQFIAREATVQAFIPEPGRFERLRQEATQLAAHYPVPEERPPLYGIAIGVKDIFHVDGFPTQAGTQIPAFYLNGLEAEVVTLLKQAGALILGKTVTTEFAYFAPGPTHNPRRLNHTPGGSSSGSAAAVGAALSPLTLGTQTIGSIIRPAAYCGVVGFKPSYGRISIEGVIPLALSADHIGFFTSDVAGTELVARLLCQSWRDNTSVDSLPVLGIPEGPYLDQATREGKIQFQAVQEKLSQAGFTVRSVPTMSNFEEISLHHRQLVAAEAARIHQEWFAQFPDLYHPKTIALIEAGRKVSTKDYEASQAGRHQLRETLTTLIAKEGISVWIAPSAQGTAPPTLESTGDPIMNLPWTHAGLPVISLPSGRSEIGLPFGLQIVGNWQQDEELIQWAKQIEAAFHQR